MIKITSFYPFSNFLRVTQEFHEDKIIVKTKSLTYEQEVEFPYSDVSEISDRYNVANSQTTFGCWLLVFTTIALGFFCNVLYANPVLLRITQVIYICGILLVVTSFIKNWYIVLSDKDHKILAEIKQTRHNRDLVLQAIELTKSKSEGIQEISAADPFLEIEPAFEYEYHNIRDFEKTTDRFYEDQVRGFEKSLFYEKSYIIKYDVLSRKIYKGKIGVNAWGWIFAIIMIVMTVMMGLFRGFNILPRIVYVYSVYAFLITLAISWLLKFVKREVMGLYGKNGNIAYWAYVNRADKEKFEKIIEFIQSKIPAENKEGPLKE